MWRNLRSPMTLWTDSYTAARPYRADSRRAVRAGLNTLLCAGWLRATGCLCGPCARRRAPVLLRCPYKCTRVLHVAWARVRADVLDGGRMLKRNFVSAVLAAVVFGLVSPAAPSQALVQVPMCSANQYKNSYGKCVNRPRKAPRAPAGATAQCRDGSWSFSQHRSGTCSHHGGVSRWL